MVEPVETGFGFDHLPYGIFSRNGYLPRVGVRLGDQVLDVSDVRPELAAPSLNPFLALGRPAWEETRAQIVASVDDLPAHPLADVELHLPFEVADYVDFYASLHHASNVGSMFRPDQEPLLPNWRHLPVAYHGRAGTVVPSGTPITRPSGQRKVPVVEPVETDRGVSASSTNGIEFGPSERLDIEAELGFVVGAPSTLGEPVPVSSFADHVFGVVGVNDWSARDIQAWEYVPLGPFLGKSFATSISLWVTPLAALDAAWCDLPGQDPRPLPHLDPDGARGLDIDVEIELNGEVISRPPYSSMYWGPSQFLAHMTSNGASLRTGDLFASGTISGPERDERGCLLELTWSGAEPLPDGHTFLDDGDTVVLRYSAPGTGGDRITLGEVVGVIRPARG